MTDPQAVFPENAPKAIGPYSPAIIFGDLIFASGQTGIDPATHKLIDGDVTAQTHQVLQNLRNVVEAAGGDFEHVLKTTVFLTTMAHFAEMNAVYATYFPGMKPARSTVAVAQLPLNALVEIECVAYRKESTN